MPTFNSILNGGTFTFELGPEKLPFIIHKKVVEDNSAALAALMNNGIMQESTAGIARLPDTEADTFSLFAEFAYTGFYRATAQSRELKPQWLNIFCYECKEFHVVPGSRKHPPNDCPSCGTLHTIVGDIESKKIVYDSPKKDRTKSRKRKSLHCSSEYNDVFQRANTLETDDGLEASQFKARLYPAMGKSHTKLVGYLAKLQPVDLITQNVSAHARLYVFCHKYMIEPLKKLCLHKLHRDLVAFSITPSNVAEIVELLRYTYENTTDQENEQDEDYGGRKNTQRKVNNLVGSNIDGGDIETRSTKIIDNSIDAIGPDEEEEEEEEMRLDNVDSSSAAAADSNQTPATAIGDDKDLRDLVMAYAIVKAQELMRYACFKLMLQNGGQLVNDFTKGLTRRIAMLESTEDL